ncbi:MAG: hypothetical protein A3F82_09045 [Deltaproteobacteria bacterium RIFCSPLOWO2_12_FULL_44_12]|nr:MAG: hypothetical protein A2712_00825 [Deltaproteobacteria bacterium RIFCSPHIGHO2_01_FULL_43_49]OGQ14182.1 MAG: hypothetical protein A3D22_09785 [Deltaproteobacteria bacterium RIFCSPHIGHO2_02_FULL_44_53]OGQ27398.1 MAG: hypothetical protein A3D98_03385 [Deltaproteobacteria bacterium RIFCSPHIGHO2_12_FULL_44_21]OGQ30646.1 MAG: hypothetical protein A2979_05810 [Deltaproteobacteria bacterium RIFCSPLOWO2_01_FULL_45_74]OGQ42324.1 MAG: hypothetical protein A3I70_02300 [Deltaproteobacteria bacterium 
MKNNDMRQRGKMQRKKSVFISVSCFFVSLFLTVFSFASSGKLATVKPVASTTTPIQAIKDLDKMAEQYKIGKNLTEADKAFNVQLKQKILRGTFDLRELARIALDHYWNQRTPQEQNQFVELLTNLLEERSLFSKEKAAEKGNDQPYSINYKSQNYLNKEKSEAMAKTTVRIKSKNLKVDLNYKLKRTNSDWKIYDVIMDDASLVENYRYSFGNIIKKHGYPELVRRMQTKLDEFRSKRS